jgi:hypothetical protein
VKQGKEEVEEEFKNQVQEGKSNREDEERSS